MFVVVFLITLHTGVPDQDKHGLICMFCCNKVKTDKDITIYGMLSTSLFAVVTLIT